jgi:peptidoglycan/xylan/chitin deacetylase (PgdA/CDA1 family)
VSGPLVLAYHGLAEVPHRLDPDGLMVPPAAFRRHVARLRRRGYRFVKQSEFVRMLDAGKPLAGVCSLTFDDAPADNATTLVSLLEELDLCATVYACPGLLGEPYPFVAPEADIRFCTADELLSLAGNPRVEIGSHTRRHTRMDEAGEEEALEELRASREALERMLGTEVRSFAYPCCGYSVAAATAAARAGYTSAVTCGPRGGMRPFELHRESPGPADGRLAFELKSRGVFFTVRRLPPVRLARWALRPLRYR